MWHALGCCFAVPRQRVPTQIDARRQHQPVIGNACVVCQRYEPRLRIDSDCRRARQHDAIISNFVQTELLRLQVSQAGDHGIAQGACDKTRAPFDQRDRNLWIDAPDEARTGRTRKPTADHDNTAGRALRYGGNRQRSRSNSRRGGEQIAPADRVFHVPSVFLGGVPIRNCFDLRACETFSYIGTGGNAL
jgi:hypothetical protein